MKRVSSSTVVVGPIGHYMFVCGLTGVRPVIFTMHCCRGPVMLITETYIKLL